ncbi:GNAT family N-acetyltransferase [Myroides odoratus]|uniref:Ribosomal-protein-alanine acetyltransferase n=1 Tax=Myroides odoratus TaxID=256 RepID=A0A378RJM6_MYROD|nr:GNAT family N-acetyltransferase [Myroides odoratus]QQU05286.1 GNAT family N-acetyltransferase [Myroides odoratus]STZ27212.1 ribosomal-protein-alanine acetyltransferase [Myroides odoratus]
MEHTVEIKSIESNLEIEKCLEVALVLRPHLKKESWLSTIQEMIATEKYAIKGIYDNEKVVSFIGYRIMTTLHSGKMIYIDDLCTLEQDRAKGLAGKLLSHVKEIALTLDLDAVTLDTEFTNHTAQKLYFKNDFRFSAVHLHSYLK